MFTDRFTGGPLDGEQRPADATTLGSQRITDVGTGVAYVRDPGDDTDTVRAWRVEEQAPQPGEFDAVMARNRKGITLGQLREFVDQAQVQGWPDDHRPRAVATWKLKLVDIEASPRGK